MFEDRLKQLRENKGLNMRQVALDLKMPYTTYVGYEKNEREPNSETLLSLAEYYNCSVDYLIGRTGQIQVQRDNDELTAHEIKVLSAYRQQPSMQEAVDRLLGVSDDYIATPMAARSESNRPAEITYISKDKIGQIKNAESVEDKVDL